MQRRLLMSGESPFLWRQSSTEPRNSIVPGPTLPIFGNGPFMLAWIYKYTLALWHRYRPHLLSSHDSEPSFATATMATATCVNAETTPH